MAQLISVKLSRFDASPWGFRLQGGKDFGQPLVIQKVNGNSPAEKAGLQAGDALIKVNNVELFNLNHKDAQNAIVRAGNNFELTIQRGSSTWKPSVTPVGPAPTIQSGGNIQPVTKTSLAYKGPPAPQVNAYNLAPRPFGGSQVNGETIKSITSKQYNTPVALYSEETIAETLSAQAEVLAGGVLGVNFKKNEKTYNAANSEVLKMVQEIDKEPREQEPAPPSSMTYYSTASHAVGGRAVSPRPVTPLATQLPPQTHSEPSTTSQPVSSDTPKCSECERFIIGGKVPSAVIASSIAAAPAPFQSQFSTPSAAAPGSPQPGTLAPLPFHAPYLGIRHVNAPRSYLYQHKTPTSNIQAPKVNLNQPAVPSPLTRPQSGIFAGFKTGSNFRGGGAGGAKGATFAGATTPRRGKGVLNPPNAMRIPLCASCNGQIRGPFITALGKIWCPEHFICTNAQCRRPLADIGFVEEEGQGLFCEFCFEKYIAPNCDKCTKKIKGDCLNAIGKHFHPECFNCAYCGKLFGNSPFFLEDGLPYCEADWNELFTTKCFACGFPIEAGDRWVEALNNNYHSQCFNCTACKTNLEGQSFFAKGGRPFCKAHAR